MLVFNSKIGSRRHQWRGLIRLLYATALVCLPVHAVAQTTSANNSYPLQAGDVLEILVWKEVDLQREVRVRPDGGISFPLAGDIAAEDKTVQQLGTEIARRLTKFIPEPVVTVVLKESQGNRIYVIGKVNKPGEFVVNRFVDVIQALSMAGGLTPYAASNNVKILRRRGGRLTVLPFRYSDIEKGRSLEQNIVLRGGDTVLVP